MTYDPIAFVARVAELEAENARLRRAAVAATEDAIRAERENARLRLDLAVAQNRRALRLVKA